MSNTGFKKSENQEKNVEGEVGFELTLAGKDLKEQIDFHLLGGKFYPRNRFYYALNEAELLREISFDLAFIGAAGLKNGQVSFEDQEDAYLKKLALKQAKTKILLAEQAKVKKESTYILGNISDFDYWITDQKPSPELEALLAGKVTIIY